MLIFLCVIILLILGYGLLLLLPKGFLFQEFGQLPIYLFKTSQVSLKGMSQQKIRFGKHRKQYLILFQSENNRNTNKPLIVYYHGGGWAFGSPEQFANNAKFFVDLGYNVVMPSYRRLPFYRNRAIAEDRLLALEKTKKLIIQKAWSNQKIILGGMSAGGNVAALLLYDRQSLAKIGIQQSLFAGIMLHGAPLNLSKMWMSPVLYCYAGLKSSKSFTSANPINFLQQEEQTPVLVIHGTKDGMVSFKSASSFVDRLSQLGATNIAFHPLKGSSHLDVGKWAFEENYSARVIRDWLKEVS